MKKSFILFAVLLSLTFGISAQTFFQANDDGVEIKYTVTSEIVKVVKK